MHYCRVVNGCLQPCEQPDVQVPWWSFTKTVLAAAALTLVRDGLIGLDDHLPEGPFTLRQVLRHEAGLADYGQLADYHAAVERQDAPWPVEDMLQRLEATRLRYAPGTGWGYSNVGYLYVARLIERSTGLVLQEALAQRVFLPLGLYRVRLASTPADMQAVELGNVAVYDPGWVYHGLLVGPLGEAALLLDRLLTGALLPAALLQQMQDAKVLGGPIPGRPWSAPGYALGLMHGPVDDGLLLSGHTGGGPGSVIAVYGCARGQGSASCAVFAAGAEQGAVEAEAVRLLADALAPAAR